MEGNRKLQDSTLFSPVVAGIVLSAIAVLLIVISPALMGGLLSPVGKSISVPQSKNWSFENGSQNVTPWIKGGKDYYNFVTENFEGTIADPSNLARALGPGGYDFYGYFAVTRGGGSFSRTELLDSGNYLLCADYYSLEEGAVGEMEIGEYLISAGPSFGWQEKCIENITLAKTGNYTIALSSKPGKEGISAIAWDDMVLSKIFNGRDINIFLRTVKGSYAVSEKLALYGDSKAYSYSTSPIIGSLSMKVQYWDGKVWIDDKVVSSREPVKVLEGGVLQLDDFWERNGGYSTNRAGRFRVYAYLQYGEKAVYDRYEFTVS